MAEPNSDAFITTDFFDDIKPSQLSSDDIHRYASRGLLVTEYDEDRLLPAGYKLRFLGKLIQWEPANDGKLERLEENITDGEPVVLRGNSIAYLHMHEEFRLPQYIAARFNLRITHVHQGLLLGTGPVVDPGFCGKLLVPLHNLTANSYSFMGGDSFIHVEFTKLNPLRRWSKEVDPDSAHDDKYVAFPREKITSSPDYYFNKGKVLEHGGVVSNLTPLTTKVDSALADIERKQNIVKWISFGGATAVLVLIFTALQIVLQAHHIWTKVDLAASDADAKLTEARRMLDLSIHSTTRPEVGTAKKQQDLETGDVGSSEPKRNEGNTDDKAMEENELGNEMPRENDSDSEAGSEEGNH